MTDLKPETFDLGAWLTDAKLPEQSATVFQRADLIGELTELERRIQNEAEVAPGETAAGGSTLIRKYRKLAAEFEASKLTVYVRATTAERNQELVEDFEPLSKDATAKEKKARIRDIGCAILSDAIVGMAPGNSPRQPVTLEPAQVVELESKIGNMQMEAINTAWRRACNELPSVDADFLLKFSSPASGDE